MAINLSDFNLAACPAIIFSLTIKCFSIFISGQPGLQVEHKTSWHKQLHSWVLLTLWCKMLWWSPDWQTRLMLRSLNGERPGTRHKNVTRPNFYLYCIFLYSIVSVNVGRENPCVFYTRIRELLLYTGHHTGMHDHSDIFSKVAPLPQEECC
jgi:hypothetical protein